MASASAQAHYNYPILDASCMCDICTDWRLKREAYLNAQAPVDRHNRSCRCDDCRLMRRVRTVYHAAVNRRDLYSEMSWLVRDLPEGSNVMTWLKGEMARPDRGDGWWEGRAPYYPMAHFLSRGLSAISTFVTGVSGFVQSRNPSLEMAV